MDDKLNALFKTSDDKSISLEHSIKFIRTKRKINKICTALCIENPKYNPQFTVESINNYLSDSNKLDRVLYSEISSYIFSLDVSQRACFISNAEKLLFYSLDDNHIISDDCRKLIIKIFDHSQLALHQIENVKNIFGEEIENAKNDLYTEIKGIEKNYISILGIFASIILAFVGGITFSSSVLQNIDKASTYRLIFVIIILAFTLINTIHFLLKFILYINDKEKKMYSIKLVNIFMIIILIIVFISWLIDIYSFQNFIANYLPW